jgi:DNA modification methylase
MTFKANAIYCGDCQKVLFNHFPEKSIDLIYIDPPFFSNKYYEVIWKDGYELRAFEDRWKGGIENYISWVEPKLRECHRVLKDTGSMYLHCDWRANAHLRLLMDEIFNERNFQNEVIWKFSVGGRSAERFGRKHNTIYWYSKSNKWIFNKNAISVPRKTGYKSFGGRIIEEDGKKYQIKVAASGKEYKYRLDAGKTPEDVWEIESIQSQSKERLGYPTQKPEALLERIIKASSNPGDIVLDPMCGCGTAIAEAYKLGRRYMGIDISPVACKVMLQRMHKIDGTILYNLNDVIGYPRTIMQIKELTPFEFQNYICELLLARPSIKKSGDMGIDGYCIDSKPIQIKQSEKVGRNVVDNFETAIQRKGKKEGIIVAYSFGKGAYEEAARARRDGLQIQLKTLEELMADSGTGEEPD